MLGELLRRAGHDVHTVRQLGLERAGDEVLLSMAAQAGWTVITHNVGDFTLLHAAWLRWSNDWNVVARHAGIVVLIPPIAPQPAAEVVLSLIAEEEQLTNTLLIWRRHTGWTRSA